jgi:fatty-acyl-CoA synthase
MIKIFDWAGKWAEYKAEAAALAEYETGRTLSWSQLNNLACYTAGWLKNEFGIGKGDRIAILAENSLELSVLFAAAQKTGIVLVPLNFRLTSSEIDYLIGNCEPKAVMAEHKFADNLTSSLHYQQTTIKISIEDIALKNDAVLASDVVYTFKNEALEEDHPVFLIYTSGTTAFPKGSIYTHKMLFWNSVNTQLRLNLTADDRSINCAPSFHTGGWNVLLTPFLHHGAFTLLMRKFEPREVLQALEDYKITIWWAVPTMLKMMADETVFETVKLDKLRYFIVGGEAMPIPLIELWHKKGILIRQGYGLTEVGPNVTSLNHEDAIRKQGSIGKPNFYYEIRIVDENGNDVAEDKAGELLLKGPTVTPGYWNNEEATHDNIIDGWFHTGDLVKRDEEGFIYVVDRLKNMYISGAENVYPAEVEFQLRKHPSIDNVAIIGVPDEKWGESGMAFISLKAGEKLTAAEVTAFCTDKLAKYKIPKHIRFLDELPKNDAGKTDKKKLKSLTQPKASH